MTTAIELPHVSFYLGKTPDHRGRHLAEIRQLDDDDLESVHDYIQWMFPLPEVGMNPYAPLLDVATIREFRARPELQHEVRKSFLRMLIFYGLTENHDDGKIELAPAFEQKAHNWLRPFNHNYLRITRILRSLRLFGLEHEAGTFFQCLAKIYEHEESLPDPRIPKRTFWFWESAMNEALEV